MKKIKPFILVVLILTVSLIGCSKDEEVIPKAPSGAPTAGGGNGSGSGGNASCSTISASNAAGGYRINAVTTSNNSIGIELISMSSGAQITSVSINLLQVIRANDCVQSTNGVEVPGSLNKFFSFNNLPEWATTSTVISKVVITINGTSYALQDLQIDG